MKIREILYKGWKSIEVTNDTIEFVIPLQIGIRLLHLALNSDHENCLFERSTDSGKTNSSEWLLYGGHRLWFAPEDLKTSYMPDNSPISYSRIPEGLRCSESISPVTGIQKEMDFIFESANKLRVVHRAHNKTNESCSLSLWPITAFAGGTATLPLPQSKRVLNASGAIVLWPYTRPNDPRISYSNEESAGQTGQSQTQLSVQIEQRAGSKPLKIGLAHDANGPLELNWQRGSLFFRKSFQRMSGTYPDFGSCIECYTNHELIELETLGPETRCPPGASVEHQEIWELWRKG
ncbi:MAG: hypothetical protein K8S54_08805 [Spirochaetia bacterium]|nr:hypothetical protein [Spirochaetia bacterium]